MTDKGELLDLAQRCRSLSAGCDDDGTVRSLDRLADDFETRARILDHLADCSRSRSGAAPVIGERSIMAGCATARVTPRSSLAPHD